LQIGGELELPVLLPMNHFLRPRCPKNDEQPTTSKTLDEIRLQAEAKAVMQNASQRYLAVPIISNNAVTLERALSEISKMPKRADRKGELQCCKSDP